MHDDIMGELEFISLLDGLLLGDGGLVRTSRVSARFQLNQAASNVELVNLTESILGSHGIIPRRNFRAGGVRLIKSGPKAGKTYVQQDVHYVSSRDVRGLLGHWNRWYHTGKKAVPPDISLKDPRTLALWHMGDGSYQKTVRGVHVVHLHTNGFDDPSVETLCAALQRDHGLHSNIVRWRRTPVIALRSMNAKEFCDITRSHMEPHFLYKVPYIDIKHHHLCK